MREEIQRIQQAMEREGYVTDRAVATAVHLSMTLGKPLLVEGHPGVGKTEIAKVLAVMQQGDLIRLQQDGDQSVATREADIFSERFLLKRPLLAAITHQGRPPVLLIDEVDRADEEFEAFLLEVLSDFQVTIPEVGTVRAEARPSVVLTSNRARDLSDALRRRCLYLWIDYPSLEKELRIVRTRIPGIDERLAREVTAFIHSLRRLKLAKVPGVAESLDWARALVVLHATHLDEELVRETLGCFLKDEEDLRTVSARLDAGELPALASPVA